MQVSCTGGRFLFSRSSGGGHALVIAEPIAVPLGSVEDVALANAQLVDPNAKIVFRDQRKVNGVVLRFLKIEADEIISRAFLAYLAWRILLTPM